MSWLAAALRVEAYPLFYRGGAWRDVGIFGQFGAGGMSILVGDEERANGGSMAAVSGGVFCEAWHFGSFATGPTLEYAHLFSGSLAAHTALIGARIAFYTGP